jgi:hypothetical protein
MFIFEFESICAYPRSITPIESKLETLISNSQLFFIVCLRYDAVSVKFGIDSNLSADKKFFGIVHFEYHVSPQNNNVFSVFMHMIVVNELLLRWDYCYSLVHLTTTNP